MAFPTGCIAYFKFDVGFSTVDSVSGSYPMTIAGSGSNDSDGKIGYALKGEYGFSNYNMGISGTADFTLSFWWKLSGGGTNAGVFFFGSTLTTDRFVALDYASTVFNLYNSNNSVSATYSVSVGTSYHHIVITRTSGAVDMWYDNTKVMNAVSQSSATGGQSAFNFNTGKQYGGAATEFCDEIGIWNRALTSGEISDLYNGGSGLTYSLPSVHRMFFKLVTEIA